jgi:hypothetical protein
MEIIKNPSDISIGVKGSYKLGNGLSKLQKLKSLELIMSKIINLKK